MIFQNNFVLSVSTTRTCIWNVDRALICVFLYIIELWVNLFDLLFLSQLQFLMIFFIYVNFQINDVIIFHSLNGHISFSLSHRLQPSIWFVTSSNAKKKNPLHPTYMLLLMCYMICLISHFILWFIRIWKKWHNIYKLHFNSEQE